MLIQDREMAPLLHSSVAEAKGYAATSRTEALCAARDWARDQGKTSLQKVLQTEINKRIKDGK